MKHKRNEIIFLLILMVMLCFAGCGTKEPEITYEYGTFGQTIEETFSILEGTECKTAMMSQETNFSVVAINSAQTEEGGWVAWDDGKYVYTMEDVGSRSVCLEFLSHYY